MNNKEMLNKFKMNVAISNFEKEYNSETEYKRKGIYTLEKRGFWREYIMKKRIIATTCVGVILMSGVVLAANIDNIKNYFRGLGNGIDTAIENGYIANPEMDYIESNATLSEGTVIEDLKVDAKIEDFLMDDLNLSTQFCFEFDNKIHNYIDLNNINRITLNDLFVRDEENRLIYSGTDKDTFEKYCKEHNLNYVFGEYDNEKYFNNGLNWFPSFISKDASLAKLTYNMYSEGFPKSKKLYFSFSKMTITEHNDSNEITIQGNWEIELDVPEKMYNRTSETYRVISCSNDDFEIYSSSVSDTGFEIGVIISNIEKVEYPKELERIRREIWAKYGENVDQNKANEEYQSIISKSPYREMDLDYWNKRAPIALSGAIHGELVCATTYCSYVENADGEKFECTFSPSRRAKCDWLEGNKFDFYETFGLTKYDATDTIEVVLYYYGEPVTITLEKVK